MKIVWEESDIVAGKKFIIRDDKIREEIIRYIFAEERKARQRGKG